jgi:site-specific recombinase XerD
MGAAQAQPPKLLDQMRTVIRMLHYSMRTEATYVDWVRRFIRFHELRHPREMGAVEVTAFLAHLATERQVSASTQNQAKSAILFLYQRVLKIELPWLGDIAQAKASTRLPVVLTHSEVRALMQGISDASSKSGMILDSAVDRSFALGNPDEYSLFNTRPPSPLE